MSLAPPEAPFDGVLRGGRGLAVFADPTAAEVASVGAQLALRADLVEVLQTRHAHNRLFLHDQGIVLVVRTHAGVGASVLRGEVQLLLTLDSAVLVARDAPAVLAEVLARLRAPAPRPPDVLLALLHVVRVDVDAVLADLDDDVLAIEERLFGTDREDQTRAIHLVKRELLELRRSVAPLVADLTRLAAAGNDGVPADVARDAALGLEQVARSAVAVEHLDALTNSVLAAQVAQIAVEQNQDQRRISAWAAVALVPTGVGAVYGMNFQHMPELGWTLGYPAALTTILVVCASLYAGFRRHGWL